MQLAFSKQLAKDSNSVSTQGKEMLSFHVCTNCIYFYKYEITFVAIKLHLFHVVFFNTAIANLLKILY